MHQHGAGAPPRVAAIGARADAPAAYVHAVDVRVERLEQEYRRIADDGAVPAATTTARRASTSRVSLVHDVAGLVLEYPGIASASDVTSR